MSRGRPRPLGGLGMNVDTLEIGNPDGIPVYRPGLVGHCLWCIHRAARTLRSDGATLTNAIIPGGPG